MPHPDEADGWHWCHFCGTDVKDGKEANGKRHWLSDCRPDLVEHEIGPTCTWGHEIGDDSKPQNRTCYAYQNDDEKGRPWTDEHKHFYKDVPM